MFKFDGEIPQVFPETYEEGLVYLEAQRRFKRQFGADEDKTIKI